MPVLATEANPPRNRVVATLQVSIPRDAVCSPDSQYVYVASNNSNFTQGQIVLISVATHEVISQFAAGAQALALAISPDGQTLYSIDDNSNVQVISTADQTVTATINLNVPVTTGTLLILTLSPDGTSLWVSSNGIYVINTATKQVGSTPIPIAASSLAFTPDGTEVYAAYFQEVPHSHALALIDANSLAVIDPSVGGKAMYAHHHHMTGPNQIAISPNGKELYITENYRPAHNLLSTVVRALDTSDATRIRDIHSTHRPEYISSLAVTSTGRHLYLGAYRMDTTINAYLTSFVATDRNVTGAKARFHGYPTKLAITPDVTFAYVLAGEGTGSVIVVDISPE